MVSSFQLLNPEMTETSLITMNVPQRFELVVDIDIGSGSGITPFTNGGGNNYIYKFFLSRTPGELQHEIGEKVFEGV